MSRQINFRGKRIDNGEWVYGNLIKMDAQGSQSFIFPFRNFASTLSCGQIVAYNMVEVDPKTVGQFTGLKDKNGVEIYEGDILICRQYIGGNFVDYAIERGYVDYAHGAYGLHRKGGFYRPFKDWLEDYELEVVGNIYDKPEHKAVTE